MSKKKRLPSFERLAQRLVEDTFSRLLGGQIGPSSLATELHRALEDQAAVGRLATAALISLNPIDLARLESTTARLARDVLAELEPLLAHGGPALAAVPDVRIEASAALAPHQIEVTLTLGDEPEQSTQLLEIQEAELAQLQAIAVLDAFLVVNGREHFPLRRPLVSVGRRAANDVIFENPRVSRQHAQLRWRYGRFIVYDLGSRAGTLVNGVRVRESVLRPGDVIDVAGESLIYGEGPTAPAAQIHAADASEEDRTQVYRDTPTDAHDPELPSARHQDPGGHQGSG